MLRVERVLCVGRRVLCGEKGAVQGEGCCAGRRVLCGEKGAVQGEGCCAGRRVLCGEKGAVCRQKGAVCRRKVLCVGVGCFVWRERYHHPSCVDDEEFLGCLLDGLHEEMVAAH